MLGYCNSNGGKKSCGKDRSGNIAGQSRDHRRRLRAQGLRPIQIWVPDVRAPAFKAKAHRQSLAVAASRGRTPIRPSLNSVSDIRINGPSR